MNHPNKCQISFQKGGIMIVCLEITIGNGPKQDENDVVDNLCRIKLFQNEMLLV